MTPQESRQRSERAKGLLGDPLMIEAFDSVQKTVIDALRTMPNLTAEDVMRLTIALRMTDKIRAWLETAAQSGKLDLAILKEDRHAA